MKSADDFLNWLDEVVNGLELNARINLVGFVLPRRHHPQPNCRRTVLLVVVTLPKASVAIPPPLLLAVLSEIMLLIIWLC